jgi:hypothetical protein
MASEQVFIARSDHKITIRIIQVFAELSTVLGERNEGSNRMHGTTGSTGGKNTHKGTLLGSHVGVGHDDEVDL